MSVKIDELIDIVEKLAPVEYAYKWDNVGLQLGSKNDNIKKVLTTLEVTESVLDEAIENNVNMVISHHPMIFSSLKKIIKEDLKGKLIYKAIQNNIAIYATHTNIDVAPGGLNDYIANLLEMTDAQVLEETDRSINPVDNEISINGIGRVGKLEKSKTLEELIEEIKKQINIEHVTVAGDLKANIEKIAIINGRGAGLITLAIHKGCQCVITGDVKYHDAQDAISQGINVIDIGHYHGEKFFPEFLANYLSKKTMEKGLNVEIIPSTVDINPFKIV